MILTLTTDAGEVITSIDIDAPIPTDAEGIAEIVDVVSHEYHRSAIEQRRESGNEISVRARDR